MANPVVALRIPPSLLERIDERASTEGKNRSVLLNEVLAHHFPEQAKAGPAMTNPRTKLRPPLRRA